MTREQYKQSVKDIMINKNPYGSYHQQNFNTYGGYDEMTPINSDIINNMPNAQIVLSESASLNISSVIPVKSVIKEVNFPSPGLIRL